MWIWGGGSPKIFAYHLRLDHYKKIEEYNELRESCNVSVKPVLEPSFRIQELLQKQTSGGARQSE